MAVRADGDGWLTRERVKENADRAKLGGWRTVERCIKAGLVAGPQRRLGVGRAPTYRYPPSVLAQLDWVGAQFAAAGKEGRRRPSLALLVHRRWWGAGDPDYFEPWRRDRLRHLWSEYQGWVEKRKVSPAAIDKEGEDQAERWGRQRDWRYRSMMRGADRRRVLATAAVAMYLGHPGHIRLEQDAFDETRMAGEEKSVAVGDVLEHGMGFDRARRTGFAAGCPPGELVRDILLELLPQPPGRLWVLAHLTAGEAARLREVVIAFDAGAREAGTRGFIGDLRDKPEVAGMVIAWAGAWGWDTERAGPVTTETCLHCEGSIPITASQRLVHCPQCGEWVVNTPEPPRAS